MRDVKILLVAFLFISACISGCIGKEVISEEVDNENLIVDELIIPDPDKYECMEFEGWDRCWLTYFP